MRSVVKGAHGAPLGVGTDDFAEPMDAIDLTEMRALVVDAWRMVVPNRVAAEYLDDHP
jgi:hypothetical protein